MNEVKFAKVTDHGDVECPNCGTYIVTPIGNNPYEGGQEQKMIINHVHQGSCPLCRKPFRVTKEEATKHNDYWKARGL